MRAILLALLLLLSPSPAAQAGDWRIPSNVQYEFFGLQPEFGWGAALSTTYSPTASCIWWNYAARLTNTGFGPATCATTTEQRLFRIWPMDIQIHELGATTNNTLGGTDACAVQLRTNTGNTNFGPELEWPITTAAQYAQFSVRIDKRLLAGTPLFLLARHSTQCQSGTGCICDSLFGRQNLYISYSAGPMK